MGSSKGASETFSEGAVVSGISVVGALVSLGYVMGGCEYVGVEVVGAAVVSTSWMPRPPLSPMQPTPKRSRNSIPIVFHIFPRPIGNTKITT